MKNYTNYTITMKTILSIFICFGLATTISAQCVKGNCFKGHGTYEWENGDFYEGMWKNGKPDGNGVFYFENGDNYTGRFSEGIKNGHGKYTWKDGNTYDGNWDEDKMDGRGKYYWAREGATFDGLFKEGQFTNIEIGTPAESPKEFPK